MEVFWFMKKVFFKKATCFLLILLMAMSSTMVICFAGKNKRKIECRTLHPEFTSENTLSHERLRFRYKEDKRFLVEIYNDWCEEFGSDKLCVNDVFFVKEFKKLYIFLYSLEILPEYKRVEIFNFLDYCAEINGINIEEIIS